jgi:hypothetical protein
VAGQYFSNGGKPGQVFSVRLLVKVIPINVLENTCPGFKPSPSKIDKQHTS